MYQVLTTTYVLSCFLCIAVPTIHPILLGSPASGSRDDLQPFHDFSAIRFRWICYQIARACFLVPPHFSPLESSLRLHGRLFILGFSEDCPKNSTNDFLITAPTSPAVLLCVSCMCAFFSHPRAARLHFGRGSMPSAAPDVPARSDSYWRPS